MHIIAGILIIILFILIAVLFVAGSIIRAIFGNFSFKKFKRQKTTTNNRTYTTFERRNKVFGPNEGEYVEFEEVKDKK